MSTAGFQKETWQIGPDGNLLVLLQHDTSLNRIKIAPSPDSGLGYLIGDDGAMLAKGN